MTKLMPNELRDLSASKQRVISNVEQQLSKRTSWKKRLSISAITIATTVAITFGALQLKTEAPPSVERATDVHGQYDETLKSYVAKDATYKTMELSNGQQSEIFTQWMSSHYFKETIFNASQDVVLYYRLANNRIEFITQTDLDHQLTVEQLQTMPASTVLMTAPLQTEQQRTNEWYVSEMNITHGFYTNVIKLERMQDDGLHYVRYYAPTIGLIEENVYNDGEPVVSEYLVSVSQSVDSDVMRFSKMDGVILEPNFHTPWQYSPDGTKRITLEGRGPQAGEEGIAKIILEETSGVQSLYSLINSDTYMAQPTAKALQWIDNNRLFVIIGMAYGMVSQGGELFILDITTGDLTPTIVDLPALEEITKKIEATGEPYTFNYQRFIYNTDQMEYTDSHTVDGTITLMEAIVERLEDDTMHILYPDNQQRAKFAINLQGFTLALNEIEEGASYELLLIDNVVHSVQRKKE